MTRQDRALALRTHIHTALTVVVTGNKISLPGPIEAAAKSELSRGPGNLFSLSPVAISRQRATLVRDSPRRECQGRCCVREYASTYLYVRGEVWRVEGLDKSCPACTISNGIVGSRILLNSCVLNNRMIVCFIKIFEDVSIHEVMRNNCSRIRFSLYKMYIQCR